MLRPLFLALAVTGVGDGLTAPLLPYHLLHTVQVGTTGLGVIMGVGSLGGLTGALLAPRLVRRCGTGPVLLCAWPVCALMHRSPAARPARPGVARGPRRLRVPTVDNGNLHRDDPAVRVQHQTSPARLRSRVQQTSLWLTTGILPITALAAGALATLISVRTVMAVGVIALLLPVGCCGARPSDA